MDNKDDRIAELEADCARLRGALEESPCECRTTYGSAVVLCMRCAALSPTGEPSDTMLPKGEL